MLRHFLSRNTKVFPNGLQGAHMSSCVKKSVVFDKNVAHHSRLSSLREFFRQKFGFNADVLFSKISMSIDMKYETLVEN